MLFSAAFRRGFLFLVPLLPCAGLRAASFLPDFTAKQFTYDDKTGELVATGNPRLAYHGAVLLADVIRYNKDTGVAVATGHFSLTRGVQRLVAERGTYRLSDGTLSVAGVRLGQYPLYLSGDTVAGTNAQLVFTNATVYYREPNRWSPVLRAKRLIYDDVRHTIRGEGVTLGVGSAHPLYLPHFEQSVNAPLLSYLTATAGYRHNLGAFVVAGLHVPVIPGANLGADVGLYTARGLMFGPSGTYGLASGDSAATGFFRSGYIRDHGDKMDDLLGRPITSNRGFLTWQNQSNIGAHFTFDASINYWSDSAVLRDFRPQDFFPVQAPDSFLEAVYAGQNYFLTAFTRLDPNNFEIVQQRLPEIRFDLVPTPITALGVYQRFDASFAVLRETDPLGIAPAVNSNRLDAFYSLSRPLLPASWLTFTPVAGGRVTYYADATGGRDNYTRVLGEVGFDAEMRASGVYNIQSDLWKIDGIRHLLTPKLSYRYIPEADKGQPYIPPIDTDAFTTYLQPIDLGDMRNIDQLHAENVLRLEVDNTFQTRDPGYGSRDLLTFNVANDFRFSRQPGQGGLSDFQTELAFTPIRWLRLDVYQRFDAYAATLRELNTGLTLIDTDWWTLRLGTHYLQHQFEEYVLDYSLRLNEVYRAFVRLDYDKFEKRLNEQTYGISQRLANTWDIDYGVSLYAGPRRESHFGFSISANLVRF